MSHRYVPLLAVLAALAAWPAMAQTDLSGNWLSREHEDANERGAGPDIGEYEGLPINNEGRHRAQTWSPSLWTVPEHQCAPHPADYSPNFSAVRIWAEVDPLTLDLVAYHVTVAWNTPTRTIYMDGRPHPPADTLHTWEGFSTGHWEGDVLVVETTHLKPGYLRRNGVPRSADGTLREYIYRVDDFLTWVSVTTDPAYTTEPHFKSRNFLYEPGYRMTPFPCSVDIEVPRPEGEIPHYVDGNPDLYEYAQKHNLPVSAVGGGARTMYPEFEDEANSGFVAPAGGATSR